MTCKRQEVSESAGIKKFFTQEDGGITQYSFTENYWNFPAGCYVLSIYMLLAEPVYGLRMPFTSSGKRNIVIFRKIVSYFIVCSAFFS